MGMLRRVPGCNSRKRAEQKKDSMGMLRRVPGCNSRKRAEQKRMTLTARCSSARCNSRKRAEQKVLRIAHFLQRRDAIRTNAERAISVDHNDIPPHFPLNSLTNPRAGAYNEA